MANQSGDTKQQESNLNMQRNLKLFTLAVFGFTIINLIPYQTTYAKAIVHDNRYYCERLAEYNLGQNENEITSYCNDLLK